ncbi:MAG: DUF1318 domain-containing protein [Bdellovibrionota bacterium]
MRNTMTRSTPLKYNSTYQIIIANFLYLPLICSCAFKFEVTSQKTALENQILGQYKELEDDLILNSSVRGDEDNIKLTPVELAKQNQKFNLDDIDELKRNEIIGEANTGELEILPITAGKRKDATHFQIKLSKILVAEENKDRKTIWLHIIANNKNLTKNNLKEVQLSFANQIAQESPIGYWIQNKNGTWEKKLEE